MKGKSKRVNEWLLKGWIKDKSKKENEGWIFKLNERWISNGD